MLSAVGLTVVGLAVTSAPSAQAVTLPPVTATVGSPLAPVSTVDLTGLVAPVTLAISPPLPAGLVFDAGTAVTPGTGVISGTPTAASPSKPYVVTATDSTPGTPVVVTADVTITVDGVLTAPPPVTATLGQPYLGAASFAVQGLGTPVSYAAATAPAWLHISATGVISGTPDALLPVTPIDVTATDATGAKALGTLSLAVVPALTPSSQTVQGTVGMALSAPTAAFPASATVTYVTVPSITAATGLSFDAATGVVSGKPTHAMASTTFAVQLQDTASSSVLAQGVIDVTVDGVLGTTALAVTGTVGSAITPFIGYGTAAATAAGLVPPFTYSTSPDLPGVTTPGDLTINTSTGAISGRPTTASAGAKYTVNVVDKNGAKASGPISLTIAGQILPATQGLTGTVGTSTFSRVLTASGMSAPVTYTISPTPPSGMVFNSTTGVVSGIPRATQPSTLYDISATDANGATGSAKLTITINKAVLSAPIIGSVIGGAKPGSLQVFFTAPPLAPTDQTYTVEVYDSEGVTLVKSVDTKSSPVTVEGLIPGETYQVVVVANATTSFDRVESTPKSGVAAANTVATPIAPTTPTAAAPVTTAVSPALALRRLGIVLVTGSQARTAKRMLVGHAPTRTSGRAPIVRLGLNSLARIVVPGVTSTDLLSIRIRVAGSWLALGSGSANARQRLLLPAFSVSKAGTYPIQLRGPVGKALYIKVVVR